MEVGLTSNRTHQTYKPINFTLKEGVEDCPMYGNVYKEYRFEARFGARHLVSEQALQGDRVVLDHIREETAHKINEEIFGDYARQLRNLYIELLREGDFEKADTVNKIIIDMMEV